LTRKIKEWEIGMVKDKGKRNEKRSEMRRNEEERWGKRNKSKVRERNNEWRALGMISASRTLCILISLRVFSIRLIYNPLLWGEDAWELFQGSHLVLHPLVLFGWEMGLKDFSSINEKRRGRRGDEKRRGRRRRRGDEKRRGRRRRRGDEKRRGRRRGRGETMREEKCRWEEKGEEKEKGRWE
jgi:hypothetical protein